MSPRSLCDGQSAHPSLPRADAVEVVAKPALVAIEVGHGLCTIPISVTTTHSQQSLGAAYLRRTRTTDRNRRLSRTRFRPQEELERQGAAVQAHDDQRPWPAAEAVRPAVRAND